MDQRMFVALLLSMGVVFGYYTLFPPPPEKQAITQPVAPGASRPPAGKVAPLSASVAPAAPMAPAAPQGAAQQAEAKRIRVETPRYIALFDTRGAKLVSLKLKNYRMHKALIDWGDLIPLLREYITKETLDQRALVEMVNDQLGRAEPMSLEFRGNPTLTSEFAGMVFSVDKEGLQLTGSEKTPTTLTFSGRGADGLVVTKRLSFQPDSYIMTLQLEVINYGSQPVPLELVTLFGEGPQPDGAVMNNSSHFGPIFSEHGKVKTEDPDDIEGSLPVPNPDWAGITANYFLSAAAFQPQPSIRSAIAGTVSFGPEDPLDRAVLVTPEQGEPRSYLVPLTRHRLAVSEGDKIEAGATIATTRVLRAEFRSQKFNNSPKEETWVSHYGFELPKFELDPGKMYSYPIFFRMFLGPKNVSEMEKFGAGLEESLDLTLDILATPLLNLLRWFHGFAGNYGVAIILLTILVRVGLFPLTYKGMVSMKRMQKIQPKVAAMKEKFKKDKERQNKEMMEIYRRHKVNPLGGCLPIALQLPIFFALYGALLGAIELRHEPFMWWIVDLSAKDPLYVTPILMGITMFVQQRLTPSSMDPTQQKIMMWMPLIFLVFMMNFPSGLVLYWLTSNSLSILQQLIINRIKVPEPLED